MPFRSHQFLKSFIYYYIARQMVSWFLIIFGIILSVILSFECVEKLRIFIGHSDMPLSLIIIFSILRLPQHFLDFMPFILFITTLMTFWKLNQNHEITAFRLCGISVSQMGLGAFLTACFISLSAVVILNPLAASLNTEYKRMEQKIFKQNPQRLAITSTGFWIKTLTDQHKIFFHAQSFDLKKRMFYDVTFYELSVDDRLVKRIDAKKAELLSQKWNLQDVFIWNEKESLKSEPFMDLPTNLTLEQIRQFAISPHEIPFWKIPQMIQQVQKNGMSALSYYLFWHRLWGDIALLGFMAVLAVGFCTRNNHRSTATRLIFWALISGFFVHFMGKIIHAFGEADRLSPFWAGWLPPILTGCVSIGYLLHVEEQ